MDMITSNTLFGMILTIFSYYLACEFARKVKTPIANPLLVSSLICVFVLKIFHVSYEDYMKGAEFVAVFLLPVTAMLGLSIYRQRNVLKEQFFPIVLGCFLGSVLSMGSTVVICRSLMIEDSLLNSLLPKSVTTAIAIDVSAQLGGMKSVTVMAVILCGIAGAIIHPVLIKLLKFKDPVAIGVAFGTSSHAIGTVKALEMGEVEGAVSGVAMGVAGICTVIIALFL